MILSFHPCFTADHQIILGDRPLNEKDLQPDSRRASGHLATRALRPGIPRMPGGRGTHVSQL